MSDKVEIIPTGCQGLCAKGPVVVVYPGDVHYQLVTPDMAQRIWDEHIVGGTPVSEYLMKEETTSGEDIPFEESSFYNDQVRLALRNCGKIDPENIDEYIKIIEVLMEKGYAYKAGGNIYFDISN